MRTNVVLTNPSAFSPTNADLTSNSVFTPVVFKTSFNHFEKINATQAWSLLFTGGKKDRALGLSPMVGRLLTLGLFAVTSIPLFQTF
ncbi:hypothetical protein [Calothrix sp. 336/3]|uniref:hypothetical protein n=1 Tax=Calothrix sp. 336/3 TaxID=1337936 RepID=UPI0011875CAB|nr:hypothetical protein [Calothrix sp. 336/3]